MTFSDRAHVYDSWIAYPGYELEHDISQEEYALRIGRARDLMRAADLDALVITSSAVGQWFTSQLEPHEWHDRVQARSSWYILSQDADCLYLTPAVIGEHPNTARRSTWVSDVRLIVERTPWPRVEIWDLRQMPEAYRVLGLSGGRLGFELGDCMTLGMSFNDFLQLRDLMPQAQLVDGSAVLRRLMSVHTPEEIERTRRACTAGVQMHGQASRILRAGLTERHFLEQLESAFHSSAFGDGYHYQRNGTWDVRNARAGDFNFKHIHETARAFRDGDILSRGNSGVSYRGYIGDVDRVWSIGKPSAAAQKWYAITLECTRAMAEEIRPGQLCSDVYAAYSRVEAKYGLPERPMGRIGHGLRNTGGLSVHPDNHTPLEPGMILSVEPILADETGCYDVEEQFVVTDTGHEMLHDPAPEQLPVL